MFTMFNMHVCVCVHVCVHPCMCLHAWNTPTHPYPPHPIHPPATPKGGPPESVNNSITLELIKIFQFCLKI